MEHARSLKIGSAAYANEMNGYGMYILGFRTGYNMKAPDTCDIFNGEEGTLYPLFAWTENWCRVHTENRYSEAVIALADERHQKRLQDCAH